MLLLTNCVFVGEMDMGERGTMESRATDECVSAAARDLAALAKESDVVISAAGFFNID